MSFKPEIIVLAAGKGSRMSSDLPKPMHAVGGRAMLHHVLSAAAALSPAGIRVVVAPDDALTPSVIAPVETVVQPIPRGTGDAVRCALADIDADQGTALVLFGDAPLIRAETLGGLMDTHHRHSNAVTVLGFETDTPASYGRLVIDNADKLEKIVEARDATEAEKQITLCNGGIMVLDLATARRLVDEITDDNNAGEYYLTDVIQHANAAGLNCGYMVADETETLGANDRAELARLERLFQQRKRDEIMRGGVTLIDPESVTLSWDTVIGPDVVVEPNVVFGPGVRVESGATIRAFSHIEQASVSDGAVVGPYARLRPGASIGEDAKIGNFVEIKNSVISAGAKVPHLSYVGDADIGPRANIGAGTITCNYDGFRKHRTRIGADAFIGSNSSLVAPVDIGPEALVGAGSTVVHDVPSQALVVTRADERMKPFGGAIHRSRNTKQSA